VRYGRRFINLIDVTAQVQSSMVLGYEEVKMGMLEVCQWESKTKCK
jgi:hypothetical protein